MPALTVESSISAVAEGISASNNPGSGILTKIGVFAMLVVVVAVAAKKWFFPYTTEDLKGLVKAIDNLIEENTTLDWDLLGGSAREFRQTLNSVQAKVICLEHSQIQQASLVDSANRANGSSPSPWIAER
ncbi:hypothetical protein PQX77_006901 [Marasmius sp. AFHP31]|nr:hypothetical protein PQX77_006901 [Marasmius sp. AFHP31]